MPIVRDDKGRAVYVPFDGFFKEHPRDFFTENHDEYQARVRAARHRVLEIIRFAAVPLCGRGMNHVVKAGPTVANLADFVEKYDGEKCRRVRNYRAHKKVAGREMFQQHLRSPQDIKRRRRTLFRHSDIPQGWFGQRKFTQSDLDRFVDLMRWYLIEEAIKQMLNEHQITCLDGLWTVRVSVMDDHQPARKERRRNRSNVKHDDRSYHGRPKRDRNRKVATVAA